MFRSNTVVEDKGTLHIEFYAMMLHFCFFSFYAPVSAGLSLPWCPVGT